MFHRQLAIDLNRHRCRNRTMIQREQRAFWKRNINLQYLTEPEHWILSLGNIEHYILQQFWFKSAVPVRSCADKKLDLAACWPDVHRRRCLEERRVSRLFWQHETYGKHAGQTCDHYYACFLKKNFKKKYFNSYL